MLLGRVSISGEGFESLTISLAKDNGFTCAHARASHATISMGILSGTHLFRSIHQAVSGRSIENAIDLQSTPLIQTSRRVVDDRTFGWVQRPKRLKIDRKNRSASAIEIIHAACRRSSREIPAFC